MILRILSQESPASELQLKRYGDFGKFQGLIWKIARAHVNKIYKWGAKGGVYV
jgi:hypothetical protein